ncbi:MAG TPA: AraC family transcriptional regulator [Polyangiales bacterium]|nr:AraC family transcriptional regulator [Polyangiales bacterium]
MLVAPARTQADFPLWPPLLASRGKGGRSGKHAHHALHFVLAIDGELRAKVGDRWRCAAGVVTAPDAVHEIDASDSEVLIVFLDPESVAGAAIAGLIASAEPLLDSSTVGSRPRAKARTQAFRSLTASERDQLVDLTPAQLMRKDGVAWAQRTAAVLGASSSLGVTPGAVNVHPRVRRALRHLQSLPPEGDQSLEALAKVAGLSEGRFMHAFTESVGIPLRPYLAWLKLQRAAAAIVTGSSLGEAAHGAGFSDAAHMTRSFRRMFGVKPSELRPAKPV